MGTLASGIGLVSGLNYQSIVEQLIAIEGRPRDLLTQRIGRIDAQRSAYAELTARISAVLSRVTALLQPAAFRASRTNSSLPDVLGVTAGPNTQPGSYSFIVRSLASTQQVVSSGFARRNEPLGTGVLTIESAQARVDSQTKLDELNGFSGVHRGRFSITDRAGNEAIINLNDAVTLSDVIDRMNAADVSVVAGIRGDRLVITDNSGGAGILRLRDLDGGAATSGLGFPPGNQSSASGELVGADLVYLSETTPLSALRDGLGIRSTRAVNDFQIGTSVGDISVDLSDVLKTDTRLARLNSGRGVELGTVRIRTRDGVLSEVDLTGSQTIQDVVSRLSAIPGVTVAVTGSGLVVTDTTSSDTQTYSLQIEDVTGSAARDLGIAATAAADQTKITGRKVLHVDTVQDLLAAINHAGGNEQQLVIATLGGDGRTMRIINNVGGSLTFASENGSQALRDLGFAEGSYDEAEIVSRRLIGGINTVLLDTLNGGRGVQGGVLQISANGASAVVDVGGATTLQEIVDAIRSASALHQLGIDVDYDSNGTRLVLSNAGSAGGSLTVSGDFAESLGITGTGSVIRGGNLQRQYVAESTKLSDFSNGRGVSLGRIRLTNSLGASATLDLAARQPKTVQDVINAIADLNIGVSARINDAGDGLLITDNSGGGGSLRIADEGGTAARDLNILGDSTDGKIDGSFEYTFALSGNETLDDLVARINKTTLAGASVFNDGSGIAPFRLSINSRVSGQRGALLIDAADLGVSFTTLTPARDARVLIGDSADGGVLVTSATNSVTDAVGGLTLDLRAADARAVTVTINRDVTTLTSTMKTLVEEFNTAMKRIREASSYNAEAEARGVLLGDATPRAIERRLFSLFTNRIPGATGAIRELSDVGVKIGSGAKLEFNETQFNEAFERDPEAVARFFTDAENGAAVYLKKQLEAVTQSDGLIDRRTDALEASRETLSNRAAVLGERLNRSRERLLRQFQSLEQSLSMLQGQQSALTNLSQIAAQYANR